MKTISIPNPNDSWAQVELFRWQYGVLPAPKDFRPLNVAEGLRKMADAIQAAKTTGATAEEQQNIPAPFNVFSVMTYAANLLDFTPGRETDAANLRKIAHAIQEGCMRDASTEAEITIRQASINEAAAPIQAEIDLIENELKKLALDKGAEIFGPESRSLTENGYILQLRRTDSVQCEDEAAAIRELLHLSRTAKTQDAQIAALACLRTKTELDKDYIAKHFENHQEWFAVFGLSVVTKDSASIRVQPKKKEKAAQKITVNKKKRAPSSEPQPEEEAA